jgi:hypothetical protein
MSQKTHFWTTWPCILVCLPFLLIFAVKLLGLIVFSPPPELAPVQGGLQMWVGLFLGGSVLLGAVLYGIYRALSGQKEEKRI